MLEIEIIVFQIVVMNIVMMVKQFVKQEVGCVNLVLLIVISIREVAVIGMLDTY
jgi:hypothetical protein